MPTPVQSINLLLDPEIVLLNPVVPVNHPAMFIVVFGTVWLANHNTLITWLCVWCAIDLSPSFGQDWQGQLQIQKHENEILSVSINPSKSKHI